MSKNKSNGAFVVSDGNYIINRRYETKEAEICSSNI